MYILRITATAKRGHLEDVVELLQGLANREKYPAKRICEHMTGNGDYVSVDIEFETLAEYEEWREGLRTNSDDKARVSTWESLTINNVNHLLEVRG